MALVDSETLDVYYYYHISGGIPGDVNDHCVRVPVPEGLDYTIAKATKGDDGSINIVLDVDAESLKLWSGIRTQRAQLLAQCDWTQMPDSPLSTDKRAAWAEYRQALRDLPDEFTDPRQVVWPDDPTVKATPPVGTRAEVLLQQV